MPGISRTTHNTWYSASVIHNEEAELNTHMFFVQRMRTAQTATEQGTTDVRYSPTRLE